MKKSFRYITIGLVSVILLLTGCANAPKTADTPTVGTKEVKKKIVVGFSQIGAESDWRSANTESMKKVFDNTSGYELIFEDAQQKQTNQIMAIRSFIQQGVDYIVIAPVTEEGWETVLQEVKDAGIPVIIVDRMVNVNDDSLFTCWVGSDFELEAKKVCKWLQEYTVINNIPPEEVHIADIRGTVGASAQIGRTNGLVAAATANGWDLLEIIDGDFTQAKGREATQYLLDEYENINVIYCENDNEAFGAIEAVEASGRKVGSDITNGEIMILSFDGVKSEALSDVISDKISCIGECNPLHGPRVDAIIQTLEEGKTPEKREFVDEMIYSANDSIKSVNVDGTDYPVTIVTQPFVDEHSKKANMAKYTDQSNNVY